MRRLFFCAMLLLAFGFVQAATTKTVTSNLLIPVRAKFVIVWTPPPPIAIDCESPPGTVVSTVSTAGGNSNPVTWGPMTGDTTDFKLDGNQNIVVGPSGIAAASCGATQTVTATASQ